MWRQILLNPAIRLENSRTILTPLTLDHLDDLSLVGLEPSIWKYNPAYICDTKEKLKVYIEDAIKFRNSFSRVSFAVFDKKFQKFAGSSSYYAISEADKKLAIESFLVLIIISQFKQNKGYTWYGIDYQKTGLNSSVKSVMYDLAFNKLGCNRVEFHTDSNNLASRKNILRHGCTFEGILRSDKIKPDGTLRDTVTFSILSNEYIAQREKLHIE